jgi:uncharacterized membrane protein
MVKKNARESLRGHWGAAAGIFALCAGIFGALAALDAFFVWLASGDVSLGGEPGYFLRLVFYSENRYGVMITAGFTLISLLLSPLYLGAQRYFYNAAAEIPPRFFDLFYFFTGPKKYMRALWLSIQVNLRASLWGILFFAFPGGIMLVSVRFLILEELSRESRAAASVGVVLACGLFLLAGILFGIFVQKYTLTAFLICSEDKSAGQIIKESVRASKGHRGMLFLFSLSYIGWYILAPFTFFTLLIFYVLPSRSAGGMIMSRYLCERRERMNRRPEPVASAEYTAKGREPEAPEDNALYTGD